MLILTDIYTNGHLTHTPGIFFISGIISAILVIICKNPIVSVIYLISLFFQVSIYLMSLGLTYIGISYLLVYIGAVSILFIFILMLINIRISELSYETRNSLPLGIIVFILFCDLIYGVMPYQNSISEIIKKSTLNNVVSIGWENSLAEFFHINTLGNIIYTNYFIFLILSSLILLLAMIGSIVITYK